jgi:hypothetical protein
MVVVGVVEREAMTSLLSPADKVRGSGNSDMCRCMQTSSFNWSGLFLLYKLMAN